jgi:hypothetical protein
MEISSRSRFCRLGRDPSVFVKWAAATVISEKSWVQTQPTQEGRNSR